MTVTFQIDDRVLDALKAQAEARGLPLQDFLRMIANEVPSIPKNESSPSDAANDFDVALDELFFGENHTLPRTAQTYSRKDLYLDHD